VRGQARLSRRAGSVHEEPIQGLKSQATLVPRPLVDGRCHLSGSNGGGKLGEEISTDDGDAPGQFEIVQQAQNSWRVRGADIDSRQSRMGCESLGALTVSLVLVVVRNATKWLNGLVGGWTFSGVFRYSSGQPIGISANSWYAGWEYATIYANVDLSEDYGRKFNSGKFSAVNAADPNNRYFDTSGITKPDYGEFGSGPRAMSALRGFGAATEDVAIMKNFKIGETKRLQLRMEFYNLFNRHDFYNPDMDPGSATFGQIYTVGNARRIGQFGARFDFSYTLAKVRFRRG